MLRLWLRVLLAWFYVQAVFYAVTVVSKRLVRAVLPAIMETYEAGRVSKARRVLMLVCYVLGALVRLLSSALLAVLRRLRALARKILIWNRAIKTHAMLELFSYLRRQPSRARYLEYLEESIASRHASCEALAGAIVLASGMGNVRKASHFGGVLTEAYPADVSIHQHVAAQCFLDGNYETAIKIWTKSADERERLIEEHDLNRYGLRFLGPSWFIALGHVAHIDIYLKHQIMSGKDGRRLVPVIPGHIRMPNRYLLNLWEPFFRRGHDWDVPRFDPQSVALLRDEFWSMRFGPRDTEMFSYAGARVQQAWEAQGRGPLLSIPEADGDRGWAALEKLGVPRGSWFVCLHVREPGFHQAWHKAHPGTRNADILTYLLAAQAVIDRGGFVIRMGDNTMKKLPPMLGLIDCAHSDAKSEFMDVFLCGSCRFFIGTNSGLGLVPPVFGVPCAMTNWSPIGLPQWYPADLFIPKLIYSEAEERVLTFEEMLGSPAGWSQFETFFTQAGLAVIDNTPEELRDLVVEMLDRFEAGVRYSEEDSDLIGRFERMMADHGSYHGARIGCTFLRRHLDLLGREAELHLLTNGDKAHAAHAKSGVAGAYPPNRSDVSTSN